MNRSLTILLFALTVFAQPLRVLAEDGPYASLIQDFRNALASNDQKQIAAAWKTINSDPQAVAYIEQNDPLLASSLRLTGMSLKLGQDLSEYQESYPAGPVTTTTGAPLIVTPLATNATQVLRYPVENQPSNDLVVYRQLKVPFRDNGTRALSYPNQNETPNQDLIRNRVQRLNQTGQ